MSDAGRRIRVLLWWPGSGVGEEGDLALLERWRGDEGARVWVDFQGTADALERQVLEETFAIEPDSVDEAQAARLPPKLEAFPGYTFLLLRGLDADTRSIEFRTIQIALFVGARFLVTRHAEVSPSTDRTWAAAGVAPDLLARGPAGVAVELAQRVAARYVPIVLNLEDRLEEMEDEMFQQPSDDLLAEVLRYKRQLKKLRRIASYHATVFSRLQREPLPHVDRTALGHDIGDVLAQMERVVSLAGLFNDLANDLMNGYLSLSAHRLNHIMKVLTVVTVIFVPLTFIAGIYGMNFAHMPELASRWGYFVVLGVMLATAFGLLALFRRRRWL